MITYQIANAPCSWGVIENMEGERLTYDRMLDEMQETGYTGTELGDWGFMPTGPALLAAELGKRGLALVGAWVDVNFEQPEKYAEGEYKAVRTARLLSAVGGEKAMVVLGNDHSSVPHRARYAGSIRPEHSLDEAGWKTFTDAANRIARAVCQETGLRSVFHHHCATWVEAPWEVEKFLSMTDPDVVGLCFDTGHYRFGGGDPVEGLRKHAERIWHVHFKDCSPTIAAQARTNGWLYNESIGAGVFCELGQGDVDFPAVLKQLEVMNYEGWIVVEQDVLPGMGSPKASARRNREYLRTIGV